jgi:hypothetical protein
VLQENEGGESYRGMELRPVESVCDEVGEFDLGVRGVQVWNQGRFYLLQFSRSYVKYEHVQCMWTVIILSG